MRKPIYQVFVTHESQPDPQGEKTPGGRKSAWLLPITVNPA